MNWLKLLQMLGPLIAAILAALTGKDITSIQNGLAESTNANWSLVGVTGAGSLGAAIASIWATITANKSIDYRELACQSALTVLFARASRTGDKRLHELVAAVSQQLTVNVAGQSTSLRRSDDEPMPIQDVVAAFEARLRWEMARNVEGAKT